MKTSNTTLHYFLFAILVGASQSCGSPKNVFVKKNVFADKRSSPNNRTMSSEEYLERAIKKIQEAQKGQERTEDALEKKYRKTLRKLSRELVHYKEKENQSFYHIIADALYLHKKLVTVNKDDAQKIFLELEPLSEIPKEREEAIKSLAKKLISALIANGDISITEKKVEKIWKIRKRPWKTIPRSWKQFFGNTDIELDLRKNGNKIAELKKFGLHSDDELDAFFKRMKFEGKYFLALQENPDNKNKANRTLAEEVVRAEHLYKKRWRGKYKKIEKDDMEVYYDYYIVLYSLIARTKKEKEEKKKYYKSYVEKIKEIGKAADELKKDIEETFGMNRGLWDEIKDVFD